MIELLKSLLGKNKNILHWRIIKREIQSQELFLIRKNVDMNRAKTVTYFDLTVYVDVLEDGIKYMGQFTTKLSPSMSTIELEKQITDAVFAASFTKNRMFELYKPSSKSDDANLKKEGISKKEFEQLLPAIKEAVYLYDTEINGGINSCEIFVNKINKSIITSNGVDALFEYYSVDLEVITDWKENGEDIELFELTSFSNFDKEELSLKIKDMLVETKERVFAKKSPQIENINGILTGSAVRKFFEYFIVKSNAQNIYEKTSTYAIGLKIQEPDSQCDKLTITLQPNMENSSKSFPYDNDGVPLNQHILIENGELKMIHGSHQYTSYLSSPTTGVIENINVVCGITTVNEMRKEPYYEMMSFSAFQMDSFTGDFGGEMRLAKYFNGKNTEYVTGGTLSINIKDIIDSVVFSKECVQYDNYVGPKYILFKNIPITGA
jgi:PmbA protein